MEQNIHKKLIHNVSSPLLLGKYNNIFNNKNFTGVSAYNDIKLKFRKKLSSIKNSDKMQMKKIVLLNSLIKQNSIISRNKNNNNNISISGDTELLSGQIANEHANIIMNKYYYPDIEKEHEKSKKLNEEIDINKMMTFYTKLKYKKEKEELQKIINKQKIIHFTNDYSNNSKVKNLFYQQTIKSRNSIIKKSDNLKLKASYITNKKNSQTSVSDLIIFDVHNKLYKNPFHSFDIMKKNKLIYNSVIDDYNLNRLNSFKKLQNEVNQLLNLQIKYSRNAQNNIKILPSIPKVALQNLGTMKRESNEKIDTEDIKNEINLLNKAMPKFFSKYFNLGRKRGEKYLLKLTNLYPAKNSPESRSQFIFVQDGKDIILHGGYNISRRHNIWQFNPIEKSWTSIEPIGLNNDIRYAHSGVLYHKNLYIFGGKFFKGVNFGEIEIFNLDKKVWTVPNLESEKRIPLRRNFVSCGIGNTMFVHGGMTEDDQYLKDMYILRYKPLKWHDIDLNNSEVKIPPLAHHCCCLVMPQSIVVHPKFNIYSMPERGERKKFANIKEKGIYIFGGKLSNEGPINNNLYVIKIGIKPLEVILLKTTGKPPCPRYDSSLNFYEKGNMLIVHGGRSNNQENENGLNDTYILNLYYLSWTQVEYFNNKFIVSPRYYHQCVIYNDNLYIFGGMTGNNYIGSELTVIDLNSNLKCNKEKIILDMKKQKSDILEEKTNNQKKNSYYIFVYKHKNNKN